MPNVVPSQIVDIIDRIFPLAKENKSFSLNRDFSVQCGIIVNLVEQLPDELINIFGDEYRELQTALAMLKTAREDWITRNFPICTFKGLSFVNPISPIRNALEKCPDRFRSGERNSDG